MTYHEMFEAEEDFIMGEKTIFDYINCHRMPMTLGLLMIFRYKATHILGDERRRKEAEDWYMNLELRYCKIRGCHFSKIRSSIDGLIKSMLDEAKRNGIRYQRFGCVQKRNHIVVA